MKVRLKTANSTKCPRCGKLVKPQWFGYKCSQCNYEQLNKEGREFNKRMSRKENVYEKGNV